MNFDDGLIEWSTIVGGVRVELLAEVTVEGPTIHLRDVAIFPAGTDRATVGAAALLHAIRQELGVELRSAGYQRLRVTGTRLSGASPGRTVDIEIDLTRGQS